MNKTKLIQETRSFLQEESKKKEDLLNQIILIEQSLFDANHILTHVGEDWSQTKKEVIKSNRVEYVDKLGEDDLKYLVNYGLGLLNKHNVRLVQESRNDDLELQEQANGIINDMLSKKLPSQIAKATLDAIFETRSIEDVVDNVIDQEQLSDVSVTVISRIEELFDKTISKEIEKSVTKLLDNRNMASDIYQSLKRSR